MEIVPAHDRAVTITLEPRLIGGGLAAVALVIGVANIFFAWLALRLPGHPLYGLPRFFHLGSEGNLPTYFSALCLLAVGVLCGLLALADAPNQKTAWRGLALGFVYLSFDEATQIHDGIINPALFSRFGASSVSFLHYQWVVPALIVVSILAFVYLGFLRRLPRGYAVKFIASGVIFLSGVIGMEMVEAKFAAAGESRRLWQMLAEELGEMAGVIMFLYFLLQYARDVSVSWRVVVPRSLEGEG